MYFYESIPYNYWYFHKTKKIKLKKSTKHNIIIQKTFCYNKLFDIYFNICIYSSDLINNSAYNKISKTINSVLYEFIKEIIDPAILKLKKELEINLNKFLKQLIIFIKF